MKNKHQKDNNKQLNLSCEKSVFENALKKAIFPNAIISPKKQNLKNKTPLKK
jgi:hypothetical protein